MKENWGFCPSLVACIKTLHFPTIRQSVTHTQGLGSRCGFLKSHGSQPLTSFVLPASFSLRIQRYLLVSLGPLARVPILIFSWWSRSAFGHVYPFPWMTVGCFFSLLPGQTPDSLLPAHTYCQLLFSVWLSYGFRDGWIWHNFPDPRLTNNVSLFMSLNITEPWSTILLH